jgi:hypothetical protein
MSIVAVPEQGEGVGWAVIAVACAVALAALMTITHVDSGWDSIDRSPTVTLQASTLQASKPGASDAPIEVSRGGTLTVVNTTSHAAEVVLAAEVEPTVDVAPGERAILDLQQVRPGRYPLLVEFAEQGGSRAFATVVVADS